MRRSTVLFAVLLTILSSLLAGTPAQAVAPRSVALGDSYAAGTGSLGLAALLDQACLRTAGGHPSAHLGVAADDYVACSGANTLTIGSQVPAAAGASKISLTIGGNDIGFVQVLQACLYAGGTAAPNCSQNPVIQALVAQGLNGLDQRVKMLLTSLKDVAPMADIYLAGYPQFFADFSGTCQVGLLPDPQTGSATRVLVAKKDAVWLNGAIRSVNRQLRTAVQEARAAGVAVVFVNADAAFATHRFCDTSTPFLNGFYDDGTQESFFRSFHPNAGGEAASAAAYTGRGY